MKKAKKTLALILAIAMCFSLISTMAFADEPKHLKYLSIGDSTSSGYFTPGYVDGGSGSLQPIYNSDGTEYKNDGYVYKVYEFLKGYATENGMQMTRDDFKQWALCGMRPNELLYILDPENAPHDSFCDTRVGWYVGWNDSFAPYVHGDLNKLSQMFTDAIKEADVITYDLGMNCFGNYLIDRLMALLSSDYSAYENDTFELMYNQIEDEATKEACKTLEKTLKSAISKLTEAAPEMFADKPDMPEKLLDFALYCYASFCVYFDKTIDKIYEIKDGAEFTLITVAQYNGMKDLKFLVGEGDSQITIDFGKLMGVVFSAMNTHITAVNKHAKEYKFADCSNVTTFTDEMASGKMLDTTFAVYQTEARDGMESFFHAETAAATTFTLWETMEKKAYPGVTDEMIKANISKIAQHSDVQLQPVVDALSGASDMFAPVFEALYNFDNASDADISVAYVLCLLKCGRGFASHPNIAGCNEKYEAVKAAFESNKVAADYAVKNVIEGVTYGAGTVWTAVKSPVLKAIYGAFNNIGIDLEGFFATIRQGLEKVQDFVMIFMPVLNLVKK